MVTITVWLLITTAPGHPAAVMERFPDQYKCDTVRAAVQSISSGGTDYRCVQATIVVPAPR